MRPSTKMLMEISSGDTRKVNSLSSAYGVS